MEDQHMNNNHNLRKLSPNKKRTKSGYIRYEHDGFVYQLPEPQSNHDMWFNGLELSFFAQNQRAYVRTSNDEREIVALTPEYDCYVSLTLSEVEEKAHAQQPVQVDASLYRKKKSKPLLQCKLTLLDDELVFYDKLVSLPPGDYFILLNGAVPTPLCNCEMEEMEGMTTFHFSIKAHGRRMKHPSLVHELDDTLPVLKLKPVSDKLNTYDEYRYVCYNRVYRQMYRYTCTRMDDSLLLSLMDPQNPLDDIYMIVLYHNNEPFMAYKYTLLGKQVHHLSASVIDVCGPIYTLATRVDCHINEYKFALEPGFLPVKDYMLDVLCGVKERGNLMVFCPMLPSNEFLEGMMDILHEHNNYTFIQGTDLVESWRKYGECCVKRLCRNEAVVLKNLSVLLHPDFQPLLSELDAFMETGGKTFYLFDTVDVMNQLLKRLYLSGNTFTSERRLQVPDYEPSDLVYIVDSFLLDSMLKMNGNSITSLNELILMEEDLFSSLDRSALKNWVEQKVIPYVKETNDDLEDEEIYDGFNIVRIDYHVVGKPEPPSDSYEKCMEELNSLVGLEELKSRLTTLFNRTRFDNMRKAMGLPGLNENRHHMIFTGNPGTGKTTVARIMGKIFKELGVLSVGEVITAERADMVGKYIGHTEDTMKELLQRAKGNVLFIDEAYSLGDGTRGDRSDYGNRAIECLLGVLAKNDADMIVIMAGYEHEMKQLLEMNPGLRGRFAYTFNFADFTEEQLLEICVNKLHDKQFCMDDAVKQTMRECIYRAVSVKDRLFHNARWAEQFVMQGIVSAMADRLCRQSVYTGINDLCRITVADVEEGFRMTCPTPAVVRRQVGFKRA